MDNRVERFFEEIKCKDVTFIGAGVSHRRLISLFARKGVHVTLRDKSNEAAMGAELCEELRKEGVTLVLGEHYLDNIQTDVLFRTPGMYFNDPVLTQARQNGIAITSEMEVFFELCPCPIFAVTGSDGKTTTSTLISELLQAQGAKVYLGGNIGKALLPLIEEITPKDFAVVELSSFQLLSMRQSPQVAVITNISPNHLDVHGTMEEYIEAKHNILLHQNAFSCAVLNADSPESIAASSIVRGELRTFSRKIKPQNGAFLRADGMICYAAAGKPEQPLLRSRDIRIPGMHNVENYLAAITAVWGYVDPIHFEPLAKSFGGVEHRIEMVREKDDVRWYNDSIASSPSRTIAGLNAFSEKVILIAGGYDKKIPFEPLAPVINEKVKALILMGPTAPQIEAIVRNQPYYHPEQLQILHATNMEDAVAQAAHVAHPGDIVTLSPACASFDSYPNFEVRGNHFKQLVKAL